MIKPASVAFLCSLLAASPAVASPEEASLYSMSWLNQYCTEAQKIVTSSDVAARNIVHATWDGFVDSDATPYVVVEGETDLTYAPPEAPDLPLSSTQHIFYRTDHRRELPTVVSCKMKSAAYLSATAPATETADQSCRAVSEYIVSRVIASLTHRQRRHIGRDPVVEDEVTFNMGSDWTSMFPESPFPVLYRKRVRGPLRIKASSLLVSPHPDDIPAPPPFFNFIAFCNATGGDQGFLGSACEPRKWGVRYCHLPSPQYIRAALLRRTQVPTCGTPTADPRVCPN